MNYLYNGVELPALPESPYQYAMIHRMSFGDGSDGYVLKFAENPYKVEVNDTYDYRFYFGKYTKYQSYRFSTIYTETSADWKLQGEYTLDSWQGQVFNEGSANAIVWSNHDIPNTTDGTLYLAASDPVPVSPVKLNPALLVQSFFTGQAIRRSRK